MEVTNEILTHEPKYRSELKLFKDQFGPRLKELMGEDVKIIMFSKITEAGEQRGIAVYKETADPDRDIKYIIYADHDDTSEPYFQRKTKYAEAFFETIQEDLPGVTPENFTKVLEICNKICRVLPFTGTHPKRYSPLLEMAMETQLINEFKAGNTKLLDSPDKSDLIDFLETKVLNLFPNQIEQLPKSEKGETYYRESKHQALAVNWDEKPEIVNQKVWNSYVNEMVKKVMIGSGEEERFNFDPEFFLVPTTFGQIDFQPEKVISFWEKIKEQTGRSPDALIFFTRGRKESFLKEFDNETRTKLKTAEDVVSIALDDSLRQLKAYAKSGVFRLMRAIWRGSTRSMDPTPDDLKITELVFNDPDTQSINIGERVKNLL